MIAYLNGKILRKLPRSLILENGGVGYEIFSPQSILDSNEEGDMLELFIYTHVREDALQLYGFDTFEGWHLFKLLITVNGIGPKVALDMFSAPIVKIKNAIAGRDTSFLQSLQGIGKKTAERIVLDLSEKVAPATPGGDGDSSLSAAETNASEDVIDAISRFGYRKHQILHVLKDMPSHISTDEEIVKFFLQNV